MSGWLKGRWRNEDFRRAVSQLACVRCGVWGYTQAAHGGSKYGKAGALKATDAALMALCGPRPGIQGCHAWLDQGGKISREEKEVLTDELIVKTFIKMMEEGRLVVNQELIDF